MIKVWTDGACTSSGIYEGVGAWAYYMTATENLIEVEFENSQGELKTTNNRMEIQAVIEALKQVYETRHLFNEDEKIIIYSDSDLVVNTLGKKPKYQQKKNQDKWLEAIDLMQKLQAEGFNIDFQWIKTQHDSKLKDEISLGNKRVDSLATKMRDAMKVVADVIREC